MARPGPASITLHAFDESTRALVRASAALAGGTETVVRRELAMAASTAPHPWMEELLLQTYLFAGFPRALNGMREWRRLAPGRIEEPDRATTAQLAARGEETCARVYGNMYERLRDNIRRLHPLLDEWMIVEGYGKVLSRPALDLPRRELCIVAACAATAQDRQLQSHLHGALNAGVDAPVVTAALSALDDLVPSDALDRASGLWNRIRNDIH